MSKSEYKRLAVQIPDVVKVIREQVIEEAKQAYKAERKKTWTHVNTNGEELRVINAIENLKNK